MEAFQQKKKHVKGGGLLYGVVSIEKKKHVKGGGLLYGVVSIKKNALKGGRSTIWWRFNRKKYIKGGGLLYGGVSIKNKQNTYLHTLGFRAVSSAA